MMKNILIVDDDEDIIFSIVEGLKSMTSGFKFLTAMNGKDALKMMTSGKPDVILLDIMMPGMDGWEVATKIKENQKTKNIPIIYVTAKTDALSEKLGSLTGVAYIEKPYDLKDLKEKIEMAVR